MKTIKLHSTTVTLYNSIKEMNLLNQTTMKKTEITPELFKQRLI